MPNFYKKFGELIVRCYKSDFFHCDYSFNFYYAHPLPSVIIINRICSTSRDILLSILSVGRTNSERT